MRHAFSRILALFVHLLAYVCKYVVEKIKNVIHVSKGGNKMTQNQIAYWANQEKERSNRANEALTAREVRSKEDLNAANALKAQHEIVQGYYKNTPGTAAAKITAGTVVGRALGIVEPTKATSNVVTRTAQKVKSKIVKELGEKTAKTGNSFGGRR